MPEPASPIVRAHAAPAAPLAAAESASTSAADVALVKQAIDLVRRGKVSEASAVQKTVGDPLAQKLIEWAILRSDESAAGFDRLNAFVSTNPSWPSIMTLRRRTESALWDERRDLSTVRAFFRTSKPITTKGRFALARALLAEGDSAGAAQLARQAWREDACSPQVERMVMESLGDLLTRADHKARMDQRLYDEDVEGGMRMAALLGETELAIARGAQGRHRKVLQGRRAARRSAGVGAAGSGLHLQQDAMAAARGPDQGSRPASAHACRATPMLHDLDEWWVERKLVARKLLDEGDYRTAYRITREAASPPKELYRGEHEFTAGWIALRFLDDPQAAYQHFSRVGQGTTHPTTIARGEYWQGRAAEAAGRNSEARAHYQAAAQYPTAYYGQIARARLGLGEVKLRRPPEPANRAALMNLEVVRATQLLYQIDARDMVIPFVSDLAERAVDPGALVVVAEVAKRYDDARAMLLIGKGALARGIALDAYAFPVNGLPQFRIVGPPVDKSVVYSIARQESAFNPRAISSAKALGLMQVLPGTGKHDRQEVRLPVRPGPHALRPRLQRADGRGRARRRAGKLSRLLHPVVRRLQCRARPREAVDREVRRSARSGRRSDRLGGAHPLLGDAQLRAARAREHAGLPRPARQPRAADDRGGSARRRGRELITKPGRSPMLPRFPGRQAHGRQRGRGP